MTKPKKKSYDVYGTTGLVVNSTKARIGVVLKSGLQDFKDIYFEFVLTNKPDGSLLELIDLKDNTRVWHRSI